MRVDSGLVPRRQGDPPVVLTIGSFDGVHRGHVALLSELAGAAGRMGADTAVLTFEPHPRCVLDPGRCPPSLSTPTEKQALLAAHGLDRLIVLPFTAEVSEWTAEHFCDLLRASFDLGALVIGHDFAFGHRRQGDLAFLRDYGKRWGIEVHEVRPVTVGDAPVSSTRIRRLVDGQGDVREAAALLGHIYWAEAVADGTSAAVTGTAWTTGTGTGTAWTTLGVPPAKCLPSPAVYAAWVLSEGSWSAAITMVADTAGADGEPQRLHAATLDSTAGLPGGQVRVSFVERLHGHHDQATRLRDTDLTAYVEQARQVLVGSPQPGG